jgi:hypothetical protein
MVESSQAKQHNFVNQHNLNPTMHLKNQDYLCTLRSNECNLIKNPTSAKTTHTTRTPSPVKQEDYIASFDDQPVELVFNDGRRSRL